MKSKSTIGFSTVINTLYDVSQSEDFKEVVRQIRIKFKLPIEGMKLAKGEDLYNVATLFDFKGFVHTKKTTKVKYEIARNIETDLRIFLKERGINYWGFLELLIPFIHIKNISRSEFKKLAKFHDSSLDVCDLTSTASFVSDAKIYNTRKKLSDPFGIYKEEDLLFSDDIELFPIHLKISRSASINQIIDFVRKNKEWIKRVQKKDGPKPLINSRAKITYDKYEYIWSYREVKPARVLADKVNKKFHTNHDEIYIRNMLSKLKKQHCNN